MKSGALIIGLCILIISIIIYVAKNRKEYVGIIEKNIKIVKLIQYVIIILTCIVVLIYTCSSIKQINKNIECLKFYKQSKNYFQEFDLKVEKETSFYNDVMNLYNIEEQVPYIPEGFKYLEGDIKSGYVIQDSNGNEYVWIPSTNSENGVKLAKKDFHNPTSIRWYNCVDLEYRNFIESAIKNGGFYISRFELGEENGKIVSKLGAKVLTNISRKEAIEKINDLYEDVNCELINGYAYDTALEWIKKNNNIEIYSFDELENIVCGRKKYSNIYDLTDNIMEITLEDFYDTVVYRGFYNNEDLQLDSRYNISEEKLDNSKNLLELTLVNLLAYRSVIYK